MGKINLGRVILGGIVAGFIINLFEYVLNGIVLAGQWTDLMTSLNRPQLGMNEIVVFNIMSFVLGLAAVWTYAALADAQSFVSGIFTSSILMALVGVGLVEIVVATVAGAFFYKETA